MSGFMVQTSCVCMYTICSHTVLNRLVVFSGRYVYGGQRTVPGVGSRLPLCRAQGSTSTIRLVPLATLSTVIQHWSCWLVTSHLGCVWFSLLSYMLSNWCFVPFSASVCWWACYTVPACGPDALVTSLLWDGWMMDTDTSFWDRIFS